MLVITIFNFHLQTCRELNRICMDSLNSGFCQAEIFHAAVQREVRSKLPRRESERRDHEMSRHADILSAVETRMSLLQITYTKYIETGYACFIPGKVGYCFLHYAICYRFFFNLFEIEDEHEWLKTNQRLWHAVGWALSHIKLVPIVHSLSTALQLSVCHLCTICAYAMVL